MRNGNGSAHCPGFLGCWHYPAPTWDELVVRNIEIARDLGRGAIASGDDPTDVLDRTLDFVRGFVQGTTALIVPPDLWHPDDKREAIQRGVELAERYGW